MEAAAKLALSQWQAEDLDASEEALLIRVLAHEIEGHTLPSELEFVAVQFLQSYGESHRSEFERAKLHKLFKIAKEWGSEDASTRAESALALQYRDQDAIKDLLVKAADVSRIGFTTAAVTLVTLIEESDEMASDGFEAILREEATDSETLSRLASMLLGSVKSISAELHRRWRARKIEP